MKALIVGGLGGIGSQLAVRLASRPEVDRVFATSRQEGAEGEGKLVRRTFDPEDEGSAKALFEELGEVDWIINCAGMLHGSGAGPEKSVRQWDRGFAERTFAANTWPALVLAKHAQRALRHGRPALFAAISARVGSIADNRAGGWYSYRMSKAALNMALVTLAREWAVALPNVCVAALHPGTVDTSLSRPFQSRLPPSQLQSPSEAADRLLAVCDALHSGVSGRFWSWDGTEIPW